MLTYVAHPYSGTSKKAMKERAEIALLYCSLAPSHEIRIAPAAMFHYPHTKYGVGSANDLYWFGMNMQLLAKADKLTVLHFPGYRESKGVARELEVYRTFGEGRIEHIHCVPREYNKPHLMTGILTTESELPLRDWETVLRRDLYQNRKSS